MSPLAHAARPELKSQRSSGARHFRAGQWGPEALKPNVPFVEVRWILRHQKIRPIPHVHSHHQREGEWRLEYLPQRDLYQTGRCLNYQERDKIKRKCVEMGLHLVILPSVEMNAEILNRRGRKDKNTNQGKKATQIIYISITFLTLRIRRCFRCFYLKSSIVYRLFRWKLSKLTADSTL